jgi:outer membrane protein assembly factor BamA
LKPYKDFDMRTTVASETSRSSLTSPLFLVNRYTETTTSNLSGRSTLSWGMAWRDHRHQISQTSAAGLAMDIHSLAPISAYVHRDMRASSKVYIRCKHTMMNSLDNQIAPSNGSVVKSDMEIALPPGTAQFVKASLSAQTYRTLSNSVALTLTGCTGLIMPYRFSAHIPTRIGQLIGGGTNTGPLIYPAKSYLCDRYQLGGTNQPDGGALRGFTDQGCGPRGMGVGSASDPLGGDWRITSMAAVSAPVPLSFMGDTLRSMAFVNVGSLGESLSTLTPSNVIKSTRGSAGLGFTAGFQGVRLGLTYSIPLVRAPQDVLAPWQIGLALDIA